MSGSDFFARNAEGYAKSSSHAKGRDLEMLLESVAAKGGEVSVDIATGTGFTAMALSGQTARVIAVDPTVEMIRQARKLSDEKGKTNIEFVLGEAEAIPLSDAIADIVTCRRAAHHFSDKSLFLGEVHRILRNGGKLGLADMVSPDGFADELNALEKARDSTHKIAEETGEWRSKLVEHGFGEIHVEVDEERLTFEKWIYPVSSTGKEADDCRNLLLGASRDFATAIGLGNDLSFMKRRMVIVGRKE